MIQTDSDGREFKICARSVCGQRFGQRSNETPARFRSRDYCTAACRLKSNKQPVPKGREVSVDRPTGFVNPDGAWRPAGFPVFPGGIELKGEGEVA